MSVLVVSGLKKILGAQEILRGAALRVDREEKVGIVGRNGEGKTTFLRLLTGEEHADGGVVQVARGSRIGYVEQRPRFAPGVTVRSFVETGLEEVHRTEKELERVAEHMATAEGERLEQLMRQHGELTAHMEFLGGWESERRVETVLSGIGLPEHLWDREAATLSGGEKSRTQMARELVAVPELLLLDEPTNHLDVAGIEWLEAYLAEIKSAVLMVSHDRRMLDRVVDTIVEVERGLLERYVGNYSRYVEMKEERYRVALRAWEQQQDLIRREESFIKKHMGSQRTSEAKGRRKRLQSIERLAQPHNDVRRPRIKLAQVERGGEMVFETEGLAVGYGGKPVLSDVEVRLGRGERLGIIGPNGCGKSTLLRVLAERNAPISGTIRRGHKAHCGYFDQEIGGLREDSTPYEEIRRDHPQLTDLEIRSHLALFLFRGDGVDAPVRGLSGGERSRLALARLVLTRPSWMALDEPTNHLDLASRTALEEMLGEFPGALVVVSHDRQFLDGLCTRILEVADGRVRSFVGNYSAYRARLVEEEAERRDAVEARRKKEQAERRKAAEQEAARASQASRKNDKRKNDEKEKGNEKTRGKPGKKSPRNPWALERLEESIIALEERRSALLEALGDEAVYKDADRARETQFELAEVERDLEEKNREWERWG